MKSGEAIALDASRHEEEVSASARTVLVTGASSDLGRAVVWKYLAVGSRVIATSRATRGPESWTNTDYFATGQLEFFPADLTDEQQVSELLISIEETQRLDAIIHVAGGPLARGNFFDLSTTNWEQAYSLNVISLVRLVGRLVPILELGTRPSIICIGSVTSEEPGNWDPHYSAAKAALRNLSKYLSLNLSSRGIRVNHLSIGPIRSGYWGDEGEADLDLAQIMSSKIPLGRFGNPDEIAEAIWLIDDVGFGWMTGADVRLDGGKSKHA